MREIAESRHGGGDTPSCDLQRFVGEERRARLPEAGPELRAELVEILRAERLSTLFQPLVHLAGGQVFGYEALVRGPSDSPLHSPAMLFHAARSCEQHLALELCCCRSACSRYLQLGLTGGLFLNVGPLSLLDPRQRLLPELEGFAARGLPAGEIVIEVTEQHKIVDFHHLAEALAAYRNRGYRIALDDLGAGYSGLRLWSELRPDFVKIDAHFVQGSHEDATKQAFIRSIQSLARRTDCRVVAEGIETRAEYEAMAELDIDVGQGYFFARPSADPADKLDAAALRPAERTVKPQSRLSNTVAGLAIRIEPITPERTVAETALLFQHNAKLQTLPVVHAGRAIGVVRRIRLMELYLRQFGRELYSRRPIRGFMDTDPVVVAHDQPVERVSREVTEKLNFESEHDFIVTKAGEYLGVARVRDLLKMITELQIRNARYANPLTLLPGNVPIYENIDRLLEQSRPFAVAYVDLDNFKPFNDAYGYSRGDDVIKRTAAILESHVVAQLDFVGHIGGDDFILVLQSGDWRKRCESILRDFEQQAPRLYADGDRRNGGLWSKDRRGNDRFFPILSLSIGVAVPDPGRCRSHHDVAALASAAKHEAKKTPGNALFVSRRRGPGPGARSVAAPEDAPLAPGDEDDLLPSFG